MPAQRHGTEGVISLPPEDRPGMEYWIGTKAYAETGASKPTPTKTAHRRYKGNRIYIKYTVSNGLRFIPTQFAVFNHGRLYRRRRRSHSRRAIPYAT